MTWQKWTVVLVTSVAIAGALAFYADRRSAIKPPTPRPAAQAGPIRNQEPVGEWEADLFGETKVHKFQLELDKAAIQALRDEPREWAKGRLQFGSSNFLDVAVHIKGSQGSLQGIDDKPALTVSFSKFVPGRKLLGVRKIHFNNEAEDPSFISEILCSELCREAGLPAARSTYATLTLNRRPLGLYVLKEGLTKDFLKQHFRKTGGNFYDGGFRRDINEPLERIGGDGPDTQADRLALLAAAREGNLDRRWARLQSVLDTDRFITLLAMTTLMWNWDGYPMARNNYRIYHDPATDKLVFIPHGLDQMFWEAEGALQPPWRGIVAASIMRIPEARALYRRRLAELNTGLISNPRWEQRVDQLAALITLHQDVAGPAKRLKSLIRARHEFVAEKLQTR